MHTTPVALLTLTLLAPAGARAIDLADTRLVADPATSDYFYDPAFHGAERRGMRKKYAAFVPDLATRNDLSRVTQWMLSELSVGHSYQGPGDSAFEAETIPGGLLGADYDVANGRYRFKRVFGGLKWTPDLRSPLTEPGVDVKAGEYLLAVEGKDLRVPEELYERFERTANRIVEITVGPTPDGKGSRRSRWCRSRMSGRCATATGWKATSGA
jgi:tricorn protease